MDSFFDNERVSQIAENHILAIGKLEQEESERIIAQYKKIRQELRDRLDTLPQDKFTAQRLRGVLIQVESAINAMGNVMLKNLSDSSMTASQLGVDHLINELNLYNEEFTGAVVPISVNTVAIATDNSNFLFNQYETSISAYNEALRAIFAQGLTNAAIEQISMSEVVSRLSKSFLGEEWKLHRLVRTELHNIYNKGKLLGLDEIQDKDMPDLKKTLFHPMDKRTGDDSKRLSQKNPIVPINQPFVENSTGKRLSYMAPPNRPNDRAILIPYRDAWENR